MWYEVPLNILGYGAGAAALLFLARLLFKKSKIKSLGLTWVSDSGEKRSIKYTAHEFNAQTAKTTQIRRAK